MERQKQEQEQDLIFALDIGTRSIIGMLGKAVGDRFQVLAIDAEEHGKRAMLDGQIEDIDQVARVARVVTSRLEEKMGRRLTRVCVAAAGRALRTEQASFRLELPQVQRVDDALVSRLEAGAVSEAEAQLAEDQEARRFFWWGTRSGSTSWITIPFPRCGDIRAKSWRHKWWPHSCPAKWWKACMQ